MWMETGLISWQNTTHRYMETIWNSIIKGCMGMTGQSTLKSAIEPWMVRENLRDMAATTPP